MRKTPLKRKASLGAGYDYEAFREGIRALDGLDCWLATLLAKRQWDLPHDYSPGLLTCAGELDGHHLLKKNFLKRELALMGGESPLSGVPGKLMSDVLEDSRNGVLVCRRHHDMLERGLIVLRRPDLPRRVEEFAHEYGLAGWLTRYYP